MWKMLPVQSVIAWGRFYGFCKRHYRRICTLLRAQKSTRKAPATFEAREARIKGCSPLIIPKGLSKPKNASRFAKRIFLCFSHLRLRRRFHVSAGRYRQQRGNTSCEAANRRNEKKAFSEAASFFPFRLPLRGLKGASSPFLVDPARRNRWWFSGSLLTSKENNST